MLFYNLRTIRYNRMYQLSKGKRAFFDKLGLVGKTPSAEKSLENTFQWIKASFDATGDGGSAAYYRFRTGWKGSYPETTGYLIPTIYEYAAFSNNAELKALAKSAADWLLRIQA